MKTRINYPSDMEFRKFRFWKVELNENFELTEESKIKEVYNIYVCGISRNGSLVIKFINKQYESKKFWIKESYFNQSDSPIWRPTPKKRYGYIIREQSINIDITEILAFITFKEIKQN